MANNFFITGMPKAGKTTVLKKLATELKAKKLKVGGFISPEQKVHGTRTGFKVEDISSGKCARLAAMDIDGPKVAKYHVDIKSFESFLSRCMKNPKNYDVIIVDEIGRMEMKSTKFQDCLEALLESSIPLIASLHRDYVEDYKLWGKVINITASNRERVHMQILREVENIQPSPPEPEKPEDEKPFKPIKPGKPKVKSKKAKKRSTARAAAPKKTKAKKKPAKKKKAPRKKAVKKKPAKKKAAQKKPAAKEEKKQEKPKKKEKKGFFGWLKGKFGS